MNEDLCFMSHLLKFMPLLHFDLCIYWCMSPDNIPRFCLHFLTVTDVDCMLIVHGGNLY